MPSQSFEISVAFYYASLALREAHVYYLYYWRQLSEDGDLFRCHLFFIGWLLIPMVCLFNVLISYLKQNKL
jgi:hypothetical protein